MPIAYFASKISDHIGRTPENFLIAADVCVARSGHQLYRADELPQDSARDLGIDLNNPSAMVDVYRPPEEVFAPAALSALEGKPITEGHPPDGQFVTPENIKELQMGHIQNVRKGSEPLGSGDWPVIGDLIITREPLMSKVESGDTRETSLGYQFALARDGDQLIQTEIIPNHCAIVKKGRAGSEARIADAAPQVVVVVTESVVPTISEPVVVVKVEAPPTPAVQVKSRPGHGCTGDSTKKERPKMNLKTIFGLGLKQLALDEKTTPEEMAEAA